MADYYSGGGAGGGGGSSWGSAPSKTLKPKDALGAFGIKVGGGGTYGSSSKPTFSSSGSSSSKSSDFKSSLLKDSDSRYDKMKSDTKRRQEEYERKVKGEIESGYGDVFSTLDSMVGMLPQQRAEMEGQLSESEAAQLSTVGSQEEMGLRSLMSQEEKQKGYATSSLRDLEEDIRNSMSAAGKYIGARGAGDSSASYMASEALAREAQKGRSKVLSTRDEALNEIGLKMQDIRSLADQERNKIQQWKSSKAMEVAQTFQDKMQQLELMRANASKEKANSITNLIANSYQNFISQMQSIDTQALQYAQSIDLWDTQRTAELEDYATKLSISKSYSGPDASGYDLSGFANIAAQFGSNAAQEWYKQQYGSYLPQDFVTGYEQNKDTLGGSPSTYFQEIPGGMNITSPSNLMEDPFSGLGI